MVWAEHQTHPSPSQRDAERMRYVLRHHGLVENEETYQWKAVLQTVMTVLILMRAPCDNNAIFYLKFLIYLFFFKSNR